MESFTDKLSKHKFVMASGNECAEHIKEHGIFEWPLIQWCEQFCSKDKLFLDIGAHMGTYSIHLSEFSKTVYAFEAQHSTYEGLIEGIKLNDRDNIIAVNVGLSNREGEATLHKVSPDGGGSTILSDVAAHINPDFKTETIELRTLDSYNLDNVGFLKLDVEGSELDVLKGAELTLSRSGWPKFIFEAWPDAWYTQQRQELMSYIVGMYRYNITPISGVNNMYLAHK